MGVQAASESLDGGIHVVSATGTRTPERERVVGESQRFAVIETVGPEATKLAPAADPTSVDKRRRSSRWLP